MSDPVVLGVDLSTHGLKVIALSKQGQIIADASRNYHRQVGKDGSQIQPMQPVKEALEYALYEINEKVRDEYQVEGISITHQRGTLVGVDFTGNMAVPTICDSDIRSWNQATKISKVIQPKELIKRTGCPPVPFNGLLKILWWYDQFPEQAAKVNYWMSIQDWAVFQLTGELKTSPGSALRLGLLDIRNPTQYDVELIEILGIPLETILPIIPYYEELGEISEFFSKITGIQVGTPVFPCPGDQPAAIIGTNSLTSENSLINLGTSFLTSINLGTTDFEIEKIYPTIEVLPNDKYTLEYGEGAGTNVLDWVRTHILNSIEIDEFNYIFKQSQIGAKGVFVVPYWWAIWDNKRSGMIEGLRNETDLADIIRATYEGLAYELRTGWENLSSISKTDPQNVTVCGGASSNDLFCEIISNVLQKRVVRTNFLEASALGAAIIAAASLEWKKELHEITNSLVKIEKSFEPNEDESNFYHQRYHDYCDLRNHYIRKAE